MKTTIATLALALTAACGGSSDAEQLAGPPSTPSGAAVIQPPLDSATLPPPDARPDPSADVTYAPQPATPVQANPTAAYAGTATVGPGRVSSPQPSPSPRPTPSAVGGTVTVTDDDGESTVQLRTGQRLRVRLSSGTWDPPVSSADGVVVRRTSSGGYPSDQPVDATFEAVGTGSADVTAQSDAACFHTEPRCLMATREWRVHVVVR
ncbi:MAG: hypothetical protein JJD92_06280 [Frankiaceae bacterium]|nr:hypothetical protein [Frankiaceae bacterium]